jgi:hypothetical protein
LAAGVTSVREVGELGVYLAWVVDEGLFDGPAIYGAGAVLATTGGHADIYGFPQAWMIRWGQSGRGFRPHWPGCARLVGPKWARAAAVCRDRSDSAEGDRSGHRQRPLTLGGQAPRRGGLAEGYDADVIALDADPLNDITVMADPARVIAVWRGGRRVKQSGSPPPVFPHRTSRHCSTSHL